MRLHAKRAVLGIIVSEKSMKFNWPDLKEATMFMSKCRKKKPHHVLRDVNDLKI